ncbi:acyltransferase family protein [Pontibacillus yanchengensis]|uniref:Acyltransferase 3 domain-containing protein n=1 Tax=Pontibacillus yanchengensis Y32 TaxID=1385514 RepID=A0A0A2TYA4_9BACI|nr:acyltransferase family protein [Pontibacillus yanchengensis]KGP74235.1 hypothetical protein N782_09400 [Pontibacillus yanchengensis Y32]
MERQVYFDNAKWILMFLVVFGHTIQPFTENHQPIDVLYHWIYTFHMPAFIFLSGYFAKAKKSKDYIIHLMKKLLLPYMAFQGLYTIYYFLIGKGDWLNLPFEPQWALWFLVSLFCWHLLLQWFSKIPKYAALSITVIMGIVVGYFDPIGHMFSLSRTIVFFPFFLLGYWFSEKELKMICHTSFRTIGLVIMVLTAIGLFLTPSFSIDWFLSSKSYQVMDMPQWGGVIRLGVYAISILMTLSVLAWIPSKSYKWTPLGTRTLYVYVMHGFFIHFFREFEVFHVGSFLDLVGLAVVALLLTWFLSTWTITKRIEPLVEMYKYIPLPQRFRSSTSK